MNGLKGVGKLNKAISAELAQFGIREAFLSTDYCYYFDVEQITFKITEETEDKWFNEFVEERFNYQVKYPFILSLLHEVGHHLANDEIEGELYHFCAEEKERIRKAMEKVKTIAEAKRLEFQYFNLPDEIMATQWAVKFARTHPVVIEKMWRASLRALKAFYEENNVTEG